MVHYQGTQKNGKSYLERVGKVHNDGQPKGGASDSRRNRKANTKAALRPKGQQANNK